MHRNIEIAVGGPINADYPKVYKTKFLKPGIPFGLQVTEQNTKYVIKHNFDLGGESVTIPANCVLEFDGGSISGGKINFTTRALIKADKFLSQDVNQAALNWEKLKTILTNVIFDLCGNTYYFQNISTEPIVCDNDIIIQNGIIKYDGQCSPFKISSTATNKSVILDNITFEFYAWTGLTNAPLTYIITRDWAFSVAMNELRIENCTFVNSSIISLQAIDADFSVEEDRYGFKKVLVSNNSIINPVNSVFRMADCYWGELRIENNYIEDAAYTVFDFGKTNDYIYDNTPYLADCYFVNNKIYNHDDFIPKATDYYTLLLYEGSKCIVKDNVFENWAAGGNAIVYSYYINATEAYISNNTEINVCNVAELSGNPQSLSEYHNEMFKSKGSRYKYITNNTVRIEDSFVKAKYKAIYGEDTTEYVGIQLLHTVGGSEPEKIVFENNTIDIEGYIALIASSVLLKNLTFNNNCLRCKRFVPLAMTAVNSWSNNVVASLYMNPSDSALEDYSICDNSFIVTDDVAFVFTPLNSQNFSANSLIIKGNTSNVSFRNNSYGIANYYEFSNNSIGNVISNLNQVFYTSGIENFESSTSLACVNFKNNKRSTIRQKKKVAQWNNQRYIVDFSKFFVLDLEYTYRNTVVKNRIINDVTNSKVVSIASHGYCEENSNTTGTFYGLRISSLLLAIDFNKTNGYIEVRPNGTPTAEDYGIFVKVSISDNPNEKAAFCPSTVIDNTKEAVLSSYLNVLESGKVLHNQGSGLSKIWTGSAFQNLQTNRNGTTRPTLTDGDIGTIFFDKNLSPARPIWWNGTAWVDATGATV